LAVSGEEIGFVGNFIFAFGIVVITDEAGEILRKNLMVAALVEINPQNRRRRDRP